MQACNHIEMSLKQKHITIHGGGIHILLNLISHCECMAQHKHEEQAILLGCLVKKIKKKKKKSLSTLDGAQLQRFWVESVGKIGQFSSEFPRRRTATVVSCYILHFLDKKQRYSAKMYTDKIACNWLEGVRIMSLYYMHGTQRYISIIHLEKNDLQSAQRLLGWCAL